MKYFVCSLPSNLEMIANSFACFTALTGLSQNTAPNYKYQLQLQSQINRDIAVLM